MLFRIFHYLGISFIVLFSAVSIMLSSGEWKADGSSNNFNIYSYSSFFENRFYDLRMRFSIKPEEKDDRMVLAAIDDESLNKIGRWPWTRTIHAKIVDKIASFGAKVLAFDVFYPEPEMACNTESPDITLANSIKKFQSTPGHKVILPYSVEVKENQSLKKDDYFKETPEQMFNFALDAKQSPGLNLVENVIEKKAFPTSAYLGIDAGLSHIEANSDVDGVYRHYRLIANVDSLYFPSFALQAYEYYTEDKPSVEISTPDYALLKIKPGTTTLNFNGETKVRWIGGLDHFPVVPIHEILKAKDGDKEMTGIFKNRVVFLASTAYGAHDLRNTPVDPALPGIVYHMNMLHMLLDGKFFISEIDSLRISWIILALSSAIMIITMLFGNAIVDFLVINFIVVGLYILDTYYLLPKGYNTRLFFCMFSAIFCYSWTTFLHFYESNKEKKKIKGTFSRYLAPSIVNELLKNPEKVRLGGEKKVITVFFSDVRDFTSISEKLTPEQLTNCLNKYMTMMTDTLFEHQGTLDKYIGDAMVAYWGAPVEIQNHAYWAVKGAIEMIERLPAINEEFKKENFPLFKHGIGLNTGECSVGNMGSNQIFSYTALGDNMNLGARLESLCKFYGVQLNISEYTKNAIPPELAAEFIFRTLDKVQVKGKENAVTIYEVLHPSHMLYNDKESLIEYENAFALYLSRQFEKAKTSFKKLHELYPEDKTFKRMLHICEEFLLTPPPSEWDGTFVHKSK